MELLPCAHQDQAMKLIYLDHNSTTPLLPAVWDAMQPYWFDVAGNPASAHQAGRQARRALEDARERIAALLDASPDEVVFTSGATEANNLALFGLAGTPPGHLVGSMIEHPCVVEPLRRLGEQGFAIDWLAVSREGIVDVADLVSRLRDDTRLVSVMLVNHETGAIQPVRDLAAACAGRCFFHCDAAQAAGKIPVRFHELGVTTLSLSAHKIHGPKGVGALLVRRGVKLPPRLWGGHQQHGIRPGTESVALAVGLAAALDLAEREREARTAQVRFLRERFLRAVEEQVAPLVLNGPQTEGIPHTINLSFPGLQADALLMSLDLAGVACSTGSACSSGSLLPSPVLQAMGVPDDVLRSALRFSLSPLLTAEEIDEAARRVVGVVQRLRRVAETA
jgi:cysteine desulfurase